MPLLGDAALAMWWDMHPDKKAEFEDWHSHEHFPERLSIPGFRRGTRWTSATGGEGIFQMYELESYETLASTHYLAHLNSPTPWSTRMMPEHRNMVRSQCRVLVSRGGAVARQALTVRLSPAMGRDAALRTSLASLADTLVQRPGVTGMHVLRHETPAIAATTEQKIRGSSDSHADWVLVVTGYAPEALAQLGAAELRAGALQELGAAPGQTLGLYALSHSATPADVA